MNTKIQVVDINNDHAPCESCGANIVDVANFIYDGEAISEATYREEKCKCRQCGRPFILHYDLFDLDGHIQSRVFSEDINNPSYHWPEILSDSQKQAVADHLKDCKICQDRLDTELLTDAWLKGIMSQLRKTVKKVDI